MARAMTGDDGRIVGEAALDAIAVTEEKHTEAELLAVQVTLVVQTPEGPQMVSAQKVRHRARTARRSGSDAG